MKIALLGSAPSSVKLAPFENEAYRKWVEGRIPKVAKAHAEIGGEFQIWGCSPGCWAVIERATRWFELHRWEPGQVWFGPEYLQFLRDFKGIVYTGGTVPEIPNHRVYPIDRLEEKFSSYNMTSSLALMAALAIDTIEQVRRARQSHRDKQRYLEAKLHREANGIPEPRDTYMIAHHELPEGVDPKELELTDDDDLIGMWGVDMAAGEEYAYQRPGCQNFILEALRRYIAVYLPPESDLMRPMPVYGISEWDHNYIKLTSRSREINQKIAIHENEIRAHQEQLMGARGEVVSLNHFVSTWTSPYGMKHGLILKQDPGSGLGSGITHFDGRPITRMTVGDAPQAKVLEAMVEHPALQRLRALQPEGASLEGVVDNLERDARLAHELALILAPHSGERGGGLERAPDLLRRIIAERASAYAAAQRPGRPRSRRRR